MTVTVFTPVYNRAYIIERLYKSLCQQTCKDFEWIVVDDGSTDNIDELVAQFISEKKINIRYYKQINGGKHRAINKGVQFAHGELFFIVDSDDYLKPDAIELILESYINIKNNIDVAGVAYMKCFDNGEKIGVKLEFNEIICDAYDLTYKYKSKGDMAECFKTHVLKEFKFPEFEGEKFCPEALVWFRIANRYKMLWVNKCVYVCEYLNDGLTRSIIQIRQQSPLASMIYYSEMARNKRVPLLIKLKNIINFWRFAKFSDKSFKEKIRMIGLSGFLFYPIGQVYSLKDKI